MNNVKEFYHFSKDDYLYREFKVGESYEIGGEENNYYRLLKNMRPETYNVNRNDYHLIEATEKFLATNGQLIPDKELFLTENEILCINDSFETLKGFLEIMKCDFFQYLKFYQENIFEEIRNSKYKDRPSRKNCIWLTRKESLRFWESIFKTNNNKYKIFKVRANGNYFATDAKFITSDTIGLDKISENANAYWSFDNDRMNCDEPEILFVGELFICEQYDSVDSVLCV